jgi:release factor glutamine methyltransferase
MNVTQALERAAAMGLDRLDAQLLLLHALGDTAAGRAWLIAHDSDDVAPQGQDAFFGLCARRADGEPVAYLVGRKEFFALDLLVDGRVLVPRPDTETLMEWAVSLLHDGARVVDLGTGSGAIALAIKKSRPGALVEAVDFSAGALDVARANSRALDLDVTFRQGSWLQGSVDRYDLIVSNPPYVAAGDPHLEALRHEPVQALASGEDGLTDIRAIVEQSPPHLKPGGWLLLEHGHDQASAVRGLLTGAGFAEVSSRRDLAGIERCSGGKWLELG